MLNKEKKAGTITRMRDFMILYEMNLNHIQYLFTKVLILLVFPLYSVYGQGNNELRLFDESDPLEIVIQTDLLQLLNNRGEDPDYQNATLIVKDIAGEEKIFDIEVQARGNFRRDSLVCDFPPIRLNFKKKEIVNTFFEGNEKIKIVTHCKTNIPEFDQFVIREYVTYRMYNLLTPISFKVRLATMVYEDTSNQLEPIERIGFLIEDIDHLAARNDMKEYEGPLQIRDLEKRNEILLSLFQYMIGNTDWIVNMSKNLKMISDGTTYYAIPYDFDYTLLVGTDYSMGGGKSFLTQPMRDYKGLCYDLSDFNPVVEVIQDKRKDINKIIGKEKLLDYESKQHMKEFLNYFYYILKSEKRIAENILTKCN
jgi:hypothetical protein